MDIISEKKEEKKYNPNSFRIQNAITIALGFFNTAPNRSSNNFSVDRNGGGGGIPVVQYNDEADGAFQSKEPGKVKICVRRYTVKGSTSATYIFIYIINNGFG